MRIVDAWHDASEGRVRQRHPLGRPALGRQHGRARVQGERRGARHVIGRLGGTDRDSSQTAARGRLVWLCGELRCEPLHHEEAR